MSSRKDHLEKNRRRLRRRRHCRRRTFGDAERPRLTVFRSHNNIYCQLIDDYRRVTIAEASTRAPDVGKQIDGPRGNCAAASLVGKAIAEKAKALGVEKVRFDRNGYKFHGRVRALAEAAREAGLQF